jgi:formate dehydrogenase subunit delta
MSPDKLVYMANQIGKGFAARKPEEAVVEIAAHIKNFWEKRMIAQIFEHLDHGGHGLDPLPKQGLQRLRDNVQRPMVREI